MQHWADRRPTAPLIRFWLGEKKEELRKAWLTDEPIAIFCERLGISTSSARRIARMEGWPHRKPGVRPTVRTEAEIQRIVAAYRPSVVGLYDVARRFKIGRATLRTILKNHREAQP